MGFIVLLQMLLTSFLSDKKLNEVLTRYRQQDFRLRTKSGSNFKLMNLVYEFELIYVITDKKLVLVDACTRFMLVDSTHKGVTWLYRINTRTIGRGGTMSLIPPTSTPTMAGVEKCGALLLKQLHDVMAADSITHDVN
jgi:hypothetical protein